MVATTRKTTLRSAELGCPSCVSRLEQVLAQLAGVEHVEVRYASGRIVILHDPALAPVDTLIEAVARAGYTAKASAF